MQVRNKNRGVQYAGHAAVRNAPTTAHDDDAWPTNNNNNLGRQQLGCFPPVGK
jgi:hypothetical protein